MWRYVKKFFLLFIDVVFDIRKVEKDRWCTMQTLSEDRCSNLPCEDIDGKNMASAFCSCSPGPPPHQWFCPQRHIPPEWALKKPGDTSDQIYLRQVVSLSLIPVLEIMTFAIGLLPRRQCSFLRMLITTMFFIIGAVIVSCSLKWLYIITQYYDQIHTIIIHAKSGWYLWYITANFFGFSAKF